MPPPSASPKRLSGTQIPPAVRLSQVADLAAALHDLGRPDVVEAVRGRSGGGFDPAAVEVFTTHAGELLGLLDGSSRWEAVQRLAPRPPELLTGERLTGPAQRVADVLTDPDWPGTSGPLLLQAVEDTFGVPVLATSTGGAGGGGARLTEFGRTLVARYRAIETNAARAAAAELEELARAAARPESRSGKKQAHTR